MSFYFAILPKQSIGLQRRDCFIYMLVSYSLHGLGASTKESNDVCVRKTKKHINKKREEERERERERGPTSTPVQTDTFFNVRVFVFTTTTTTTIKGERCGGGEKQEGEIRQG